MCRHAAYAGPGIALDELILPTSHGLLRQSYAARELLTGVVCGDGYGIAWYDPDTRPEPARYVSLLPVWADTNLPSFGPIVRGRLVLALVRNATTAGSTTEPNSHPFVDGRYAFTHNGYLQDFDGRWREHLREHWIRPERRGLLRGTTDSEYLFQALLSILDTLPREPGSLATATQTLLRLVMDRARAEGLAAELNVLVSDGNQVVATRAGTRERQNSLYLLLDGDGFPGGSVVASEPLDDDPRWQPVTPDSLVVLTAGAPPVRLRV